MQYKIAIFTVLLVIAQSACGASAGERALAWAQSQRDAALGSVMVARHRLETAESDLAVSRNVERDISTSKDAAALSVAHEAVTVSEQGLQEAKVLLKRATAFLSRQESTVSAVKNFIAENNSHKALFIPVDGRVRRVSASGVTYTGDDLPAPLRAGDRIEVGPGSSARLFVAGGNAEIALSQNSSMTLERNEADDSFEALLTEGFGRIRARTKNYFKKFEVRTPSAVTSVRGTDFSVKASPAGTRVEVFESIVYVSPINGSEGVEVHAGEGCDVLKEGGIQPVKQLDTQPRKSPWSENVTPN
ncbi:MAG: FecR family protein [Proteobacteria bacterium]|nr:FecR family protein [Pseudomonadota bacterium]